MMFEIWEETITPTVKLGVSLSESKRIAVRSGDQVHATFHNMKVGEYRTVSGELKSDNRQYVITRVS